MPLATIIIVVVISSFDTRWLANGCKAREQCNHDDGDDDDDYDDDWHSRTTTDTTL